MTYAKGSRERVGKHFIASEFDCPCSGCTETRIDPELVKRLDRLRELLGAPLWIDRGGGFRCKAFQDSLRARGKETAKGRSTHEDGAAADVSSWGRSGADLEVFAAEAGFMAIGVAQRWIHVDTRGGKVRRWGYSA